MLALARDLELQGSYDLTHRVKTGDGWPITLHEYRPRGDHFHDREPPVLLCHGAFSRYHIWDLDDDRGLAPYLRNQGRRVFALELRGRGESVPREPFVRLKHVVRSGWSLDDFLDHDLPEAIRFVTQHSRSDQLDYVGHSMGGMLILAYLSASQDPRVRRVVTVGSADFAVMGAASAENSNAGGRKSRQVDLGALLRPVARTLPLIPVRPIMRAISLAAPHVPAKLKAAAYDARNVDPDIERRYLYSGFSSISSRKFKHFERLPELDDLTKYRHPTLFIAGKHDLLVPPKLVERTAEQAASREKQYLLFAKKSGHSVDYGHGDLLIGEKAEQEVFPRILDWLTTEPKPLRFEIPGRLTIAADAYGDPAQPPIVFLHGGGQTRHAWGESARRLAAAGWYAITMDHRGHGDSDYAPDGNYEVDEFVGDLAGVVQQLSQKPVLVGASLGGITSLELEDRSADSACRALVLVDVTPRMERVGIRRILAFMRSKPEGFASLEEAADHIAEYLPHRKRPKDLSGLRKNLRKRPDGRWYWHWDPALMRLWNPENFDPEEGKRIVKHRLAAASRLQVPTLLVRGRMSDVVSEEAAQEFLAACKHAHYADLEGARHMVAGDKNDHFTEAVVEFLDSEVS